MKINRLFLFIVILSFLPFFLFSQSNTIIDNLLEENEADWGKTVYMVLTAADLADENTAIEELPAALEKQQWNLNPKPAEQPVSLGEYSFMLMKAFDIPGGLLFKLFPGPRYAVRELSYLNFIDNNKSPYRTLSGEEVLRILGRVLEWKEAQR